MQQQAAARGGDLYLTGVVGTALSGGIALTRLDVKWWAAYRHTRTASCQARGSSGKVRNTMRAVLSRGCLANP
jgi:hypothetical protein